MKNIIYSLAVFAVTTNIATAQQNLSATNEVSSVEPVIKVTLAGKIIDAKTGESLPGTSVYFADDKIGTTADAFGYYSLSNIPAGHHVIEITHAGYATLVEHIELNTDMQRDFKLSLSH